MAGDGKRLTSAWTDEQRQAIMAEGVSVALSAGAGCGKTFVLTERFLAELEPQDDGDRPRLGQLIAITFTERAAREMRQRIRAACQKRLQECSVDQVAHWLGVIRELDSARISTIHSFCASMLRAHAVEAGLNPRFQVLDRAQADILLLQLTDTVVRSRLAAQDEATLTLATRFTLDRLREMVARLLAARQEIDWDGWRQETPASLVERWREFWRRDTVPRLLRQISESGDARTVLDLAVRYPPDHPTMRQRCDLLLERLPKLAESQQPAVTLNDIREAAKVQGGGTKKNWISEDVYARFRDAAKALRDIIERTSKCLAFDCLAAEPVAALALQVFDLAASVAQQYEAEKRQLDVLDFNDLLVEARNLLSGKDRRDLRTRLASQIRLLLVDEFQDTDPLQVDLVKALCNDEYLRGKLFLVGDYKQSIYRFRGAQPHVFRDLRSEIPPEGQLPLSLNFRSQPAILDFVNALFCTELRPNYQPLRAFRPQVSPTPAIELLWACPDQAESVSPTENGSDSAPTPRTMNSIDSPSDDMGRRERLRRCEADWIARRIRGMLDSGEKIVWDKAAAKGGSPAAREARPGDFALLFRALTNVEYYEEALRRYGIDYYLVGGHAFYSQQEVYDILNLLRAINSPCDEVSLFGVLRSPMFGLTDETLFWLFLDRDRRPEGVFAQEVSETIDEPQRGRMVHALKTLRDLRAMKDRLSIPRLIQEAMQRTGYDAVLLAEFLGERKLANLYKLIEQARSFDGAGIFTLGDFITQLSEFVARQPDEALAATNPESMDVVRLMSIHQSKGLEFPVVVVPDINRPRLAQGPAIAFRRELGPVIKDSKVTTGYDFLMARENEEDLAELSRLFYVATTRAGDYLILSAGAEQPLEPSGPWMKLLARRFDLSTGQPNFTEGPHDESVPIRITTTRPVVHSKVTGLQPRRDLNKIIEKAHEMAEQGEGRQPRCIAPVPPDTTARRQYSFSRLSGRLQAHSPIPIAERLDEGSSARPQDSRRFGELIHAVLEEVDFANPGDISDLVRRLASQFMPASQTCPEESPAVEIVNQLLSGPRAAHLANAVEVHRELEFLLAWPPGSRNANGIYLQGFIDCLYRDAAGWHLLDYKTNHVTAKGVAGVAALYEMQMLVYGLAAETILAAPPAELTLCFLRPGVEYCFIWDDRARQRAAALVNAALAATQ